MNDLEFLALSSQIPKLTAMQRDALPRLLNTRLWLYQDKDSRIECLYELPDIQMGTLVGHLRDERLAYALLGVSDQLRDKFSKALGEDRLANFCKIQGEIRPARLSAVVKAREEILAKYKELAYQCDVDRISVLEQWVDTLDDMKPHGDPDSAALIAQIILQLEDKNLERLLGTIEDYRTISLVALHMRNSLVLRKMLLNVSDHLGWCMLHEMFDNPEIDINAGLDRAMVTFLDKLSELACEGQISFSMEVLDKLIVPLRQKINHQIMTVNEDD